MFLGHKRLCGVWRILTLPEGTSPSLPDSVQVVRTMPSACWHRACQGSKSEPEEPWVLLLCHAGCTPVVTALPRQAAVCSGFRGGKATRGSRVLTDTRDWSLFKLPRWGETKDQNHGKEMSQMLCLLKSSQQKVRRRAAFQMSRG